MTHFNIQKYTTITFLVLFGFTLLLGYTNCGQVTPQNRSATVGNPVDPDPIEGPPGHQIDSDDLQEIIGHICAHQFFTGFSRNYSRCLEEISRDQALANDITLTTNIFTMQQLLERSGDLPYSASFPSCLDTLYSSWSSLPQPTSFPLTNYSSTMAIQLLQNITASGVPVCRDIFDYSQL